MNSAPAPLRALIVDDNPINSELEAFLLAAAGFAVEEAANATAALACIEARRPVLILMDIQLPGMDGLSLAQSLKNDPATRDIVIVAVTAYAMKGDEAKMRAAGCDGYIAKPISVATFAAQVRACLPAATLAAAQAP